MPDKNFPMLHKVLDHITSHPQEWDQQWWVSSTFSDDAEDVKLFPHRFELTHQQRVERSLDVGMSSMKEKHCGTVFCFAGHAAFMDGWLPIWDGERGDIDIGMMEKDGDTKDVVDVAQVLLGLTRDEACELFEAFNSLEEITRLIEQWEEDEA